MYVSSPPRNCRSASRPARTSELTVEENQTRWEGGGEAGTDPNDRAAQNRVGGGEGRLRRRCAHVGGSCVRSHSHQAHTCLRIRGARCRRRRSCGARGTRNANSCVRPHVGEPPHGWTAQRIVAQVGSHPGRSSVTALPSQARPAPIQLDGARPQRRLATDAESVHARTASASQRAMGATRAEATSDEKRFRRGGGGGRDVEHARTAQVGGRCECCADPPPPPPPPPPGQGSGGRGCQQLAVRAEVFAHPTTRPPCGR